MLAHKIPLPHLEALTSRLLFSSAACTSSAPARPLRPYPDLPSLPRRYGSVGPRTSLRRASTHASSTAINAQKDIPPQLSELHHALESLKRDAANYVNISRLGLALRSLESRRPTIRVALLGLRSTTVARKLAHLLLADVLGDRGQWEDQLQGLEDDDRRGLLLRWVLQA